MSSEWTEPRVGKALVSKAFIQDDWEDSDTMKQCHKHSSNLARGCMLLSQSSSMSHRIICFSPRRIKDQINEWAQYM